MEEHIMSKSESITYSYKYKVHFAYWGWHDSGTRKCPTKKITANVQDYLNLNCSDTPILKVYDTLLGGNPPVDTAKAFSAVITVTIVTDGVSGAPITQYYGCPDKCDMNLLESGETISLPIG
jgi:hypothetical protein